MGEVYIGTASLLFGLLYAVQHTFSYDHNFSVGDVSSKKQLLKSESIQFPVRGILMLYLMCIVELTIKCKGLLLFISLCCPNNRVKMFK